MSLLRFYRGVIWLPIILPLVIAPVLLLRPPLDPWVTGPLIGAILVGGIFGGVPYAVLAAWHSRWLRGRSEAEIWHRALRLPLYFVPVFVPFGLAWGWVTDGAWQSAFAIALLGAVYTLPLGYGYVGLACLLRRVLHRVGWLPPPQASAT